MPTLNQLVRLIRPFRPFLYSFLIGSIILFILYLVCFLLSALSVFQVFFDQVTCSLGGRAIYLILLKCGCSGTIALAIGFAVKAVLGEEALAFSPEREPDLQLSLGPPRVEGENPPSLELGLAQPGIEIDVLSPEERRIFNRLAWMGRANVSLDEIRGRLYIKYNIIYQLNRLAPHPFWTQHRDRLVSDYILNPVGNEYTYARLTSICLGLQASDRAYAFFVNRLLKVREDFLVTGMFF